MSELGTLTQLRLMANKATVMNEQNVGGDIYGSATPYLSVREQNLKYDYDATQFSARK